jgi:hypothetical protein
MNVVKSEIRGGISDFRSSIKDDSFKENWSALVSPLVLRVISGIIIFLVA